MNSDLSRLIPAVVSYITEHGGYVTKTKLLKLLYLFDVEFYRLHRRIFSGFEWKFFHLGPWAREFDPLLEDLVARGGLVETTGSRPEYEARFYRASEPSDLGGLFASYQDEAALKVILDTWGQSSTGEILDYVYFRTDPMECGVRNEPLDFSKIPAQSGPVYVRRPSGKTKQDLEAARTQFREGATRRSRDASKQVVFTPPSYDEEFFVALSKLNGTQA
jgi:hypothetical protein